jgi:hypothetical protein
MVSVREHPRQVQQVSKPNPKVHNTYNMLQKQHTPANSTEQN